MSLKPPDAAMPMVSKHLHVEKLSMSWYSQSSSRWSPSNVCWINLRFNFNVPVSETCTKFNVLDNFFQ